MRGATNARHLAAGEEVIARKVFKHMIPYGQVLVTDGLGGGDRPFTVPTSIPLGPGFNVEGGKYAIHAGDGYYGMSRGLEDQKLLVHELVHVWQGEHDSSVSWAYVVESLKDQGTAWVLGRDAYSYDKKNLKRWQDYNAEQQAQIVEDWFADGMQIEDRRFYYVKKHIRRERVDQVDFQPAKVPGSVHDVFKGMPRR